MKKRLLVSMLLLSVSSLALSLNAPSNYYGSDMAPIVAQAQEAITLKIKYGAPHGDRSFGTAAVVMQGDVIVDAHIDEFQYVQGEEWIGVPNAREAEGLGSGAAEENILMSKRVDNEGYSALMAENAGSTREIADNFDSIEESVKGKTIAEVEELIAEAQGVGEDGNIADVVSGSTLADSAGYLQLIADAVNEGYEFTGGEAAAENIELSQAITAPHGTRSFAIVTVAHEGDTVIAAAIDELQYLDGEQAEGVPNSEGAFGEGYAEGNVLASKLVNDELYSAMMAENAGATLLWSENIDAITSFAEGKTASEIEEAIAELQGLGEEGNVADVVSGATFADTAGYLQSIVGTLTGTPAEAPEEEPAEEEAVETEESAETTETEEETAEEETTEETETGAYTDGTYTGTADGYNGPIEVQVTVEGGVITAVEVLNHEETAGISDPAISDIPAAIVENNSTSVDTVSGATGSSNGIIAAVEAALADAQ